MRIIKKRIIPLILIILLFSFIFSSPASAPWCFENEVYLFQLESQNELIEQITNYYNDNERFWYGEKIREYVTGHESIALFEYLYIEVNLDNIPAIIEIEIFQTAEKPYITLKSYILREQTKEFNRLKRTQQDEDILKEFETEFLDNLKIKYTKEKPTLISKLFSVIYLTLHPQYKR